MFTAYVVRPWGMVATKVVPNSRAREYDNGVVKRKITRDQLSQAFLIETLGSSMKLSSGRRVFHSAVKEKA